MRAYVRIAVNIPALTGVLAGGAPTTFDYELPEQLRGRVGAGHLVLAPFGKRTVQGVVLEAIDEPAVSQTKEILELVDTEPVLTPAQIALVRSMAALTLGSMASIVGLFLPPGLNQQVDTEYSIRESGAGTVIRELPSENGRLPRGKTPLALTKRVGAVTSRLLRLLEERGPLRGRQIDRAIPRVEWRRTAQYLVRRGELNSRSVLPPAAVRPKFIRTAQLAVAPDVAARAMIDLGSTEATRGRRQKALRALIEQPEAMNVAWVYAASGCNLADLQELAERELIVLREQEVWRDPLERTGAAAFVGVRHPDEKDLILTEEQKAVWREIEASFRQLATGQAAQAFLLHGVTGSGKTELYLRATREAMQRGQQSIVLVPEISLTPQTIQRFLAYFPGQVGLIHSRLSEGERYDTWRRARTGALQIIIGPRSALFAPLPKIGLIIADECHDASYYQSEPPFYDAVRAAQAYARICGAACVLGSATPTVVQRYEAEQGKTVRLELTQRIASAAEIAPAPALELPPVQVVDMREELKAGNRSSFSRELSEALGEVLKRREQAILFLNRRGTATYVFCRNCGTVVRCPRCDTPLTYHITGGEKLLCHRCGYTRKMPRKCAACGSEDVRAYGLGTEKVEAEVKQSWPAARTLRWDWETTRQKEAHEIILGHFAAGHADVLIGTQMLAKGLDLPRVTLVGIVLADVGLFLPDPFGAERAFQLLTQVAGRAGRSTRGGRVILQTFAPEHYAIQAAARHDVNGFYAAELEQRKNLAYPPFTRLLRLEYRHYDALKAEEQAQQEAAWLRERLAAQGRKHAAMIGPAPCFFAKLDGKYRWQIVLRGAEFGELLDGRRFADWRIEVDPASLL